MRDIQSVFSPTRSGFQPQAFQEVAVSFAPQKLVKLRSVAGSMHIPCNIVLTDREIAEESKAHLFPTCGASIETLKVAVAKGIAMDPILFHLEWNVLAKTVERKKRMPTFSRIRCISSQRLRPRIVGRVRRIQNSLISRFDDATVKASNRDRTPCSRHTRFDIRFWPAALGQSTGQCPDNVDRE